MDNDTFFYKAIIDEHYSLRVSEDDIKSLDLIKINDETYHLIDNNQSFLIRIVDTDFRAKTITLDVNGQTKTIALKNRTDQVIEQLGLDRVTVKKDAALLSPMPGLVMDIMVEQGQQVEQGQHLLILEAMKMENVLKASSDATIKKVNIQKGQTVDKNYVLIEFEG